MIALALVTVTGWALESSGVAVVGTRAEDGSLRSTHVWFVETGEPDAELWLEAGTPTNPWFLDVQRDPALTFEAGRRSGRYVARPVPGADAQRRVRALLREKYGFRDWWVGWLVDTSRSVAVRLVPASAH